jgi:hypothetical protein
LISIFDENKSGTVDYKELIMGLEIFKEKCIEEKLKGTFKIQNKNLLEIHKFY